MTEHVRPTGRAVVQREVLHGWVWSVVPAIEVDTGDGRAALYRAAGTECWWPSHPRDEHPPADEVTQRPKRSVSFAGGAQLTLAVPGDDVSVTIGWDESGAFGGWYVDVIRPYRRTPIGWDFMDLHLDLVVAPDGAATLKDADELSAAVAAGHVEAEEAERAHRRCDQMRDLAARRAGVFGEPWPDWRPDPTWPVPRLRSEAGRALASSPTPADLHFEPEWWFGSEEP